MGLTQKLGTIPLAIQTDSSNNVGIGGAANASYKLAVTGAGLFTGALTADGAASEGSIKIERDSVAANTVIGSLAFTNNNSATTYGKVFGGRNAAGDGYVALGTGISNNLYALETGNVAIGTTTPDTKLQVAGTGATGLSVRTNTSGDAFMRLYRDSTIYAHWYADRTNSKVTFGAVENVPLTFDTNGTERMRITSGGAVAIGTNGNSWNSSYRALQLGNGWAMMAHATNSDGYVVSNAYYDNSWRVSAQTNVRFSILRVYDGLLLETANSTAAVGTAVATTNVFIVNISGNVTNLNNSYGGISDIKLKENIVDTTPKLDDLLKVKVRNYNLKGDDKKQIGVIAQELEEIFPGLIEEKNDTIKNENGENVETGETTKSVKYSVFVPMLIKAIQELSAKVTALENK